MSKKQDVAKDVVEEVVAQEGVEQEAVEQEETQEETPQSDKVSVVDAVGEIVRTFTGSKAQEVAEGWAGEQGLKVK